VQGRKRGCWVAALCVVGSPCLVTLVWGGWAIWAKYPRAPSAGGLTWATPQQVYWSECLVWRPYPKNSYVRVRGLNVDRRVPPMRTTLMGSTWLAQRPEDIVVALSPATGSAYVLDTARHAIEVFHPDPARHQASGAPVDPGDGAVGNPAALLTARGSGHVFLVAGGESGNAVAQLVDLDGPPEGRHVAVPVRAASVSAIWEDDEGLVVLSGQSAGDAWLLETSADGALRERTPVDLPARPTLFVSRSELVLLRDAETDARPSRAIRWNWKTGDRQGAAVAAPHSQQVAVSPDGQSIAWFEAAPTPGAAAEIRMQRLEW